MAQASPEFISYLVKFGRESDANKTLLRERRDAAFIAIDSGQGGAITSGSGNGVSFSQEGDMTNVEKFSAYSRALEYIALGLTPGSRTYARVI